MNWKYYKRFRKHIETNREQQHLDKASWNAWLFRDREFACVSEDIVKETLTKDVSFPSKSSHSKKGNNFKILGRGVVTKFSLQSMSADSLILASVTRSHSVKFKIIIFLSTGSGPSSSASLRKFKFRISTRCYKKLSRS